MTIRQEFEAWLARRLNKVRGTDKWNQERIRSYMTSDGNYGRRDWNLAFEAFCAGKAHR